MTRPEKKLSSLTTNNLYTYMFYGLFGTFLVFKKNKKIKFHLKKTPGFVGFFIGWFRLEVKASMHLGKQPYGRCGRSDEGSQGFSCIFRSEMRS